MKKTFILLSLLGISMVQAQVGINNEEPQATLEVKSGSANDNAKVEGLLIPRVSKNKALLMAASDTKPEESTMIYVNDLVTGFTAPTDGTESTVADITENGYYHWNGAKWVKNSGKDGELWAQRDNNGITETYLKPANANGNLFRYREDGKIAVNLGGVTKEMLRDDYRYSNQEEIPYSVAISSDVLPLSGTIGNSDFGQYFFSQANLILKEDHVANATTPKNYYEGASVFLTTEGVTSPIEGMEGAVVSTNHLSSGYLGYLNGFVVVSGAGNSIIKPRTGYVTGISNRAVANNTTGLRGVYNITEVLANGTARGYLEGLLNHVTVSEGATVEGRIIGSKNIVDIRENVSINTDSQVFGNSVEIMGRGDHSGNDFWSSRSSVSLIADGTKLKNVYLTESASYSPGVGTEVENLYGFRYWNPTEQMANWTAKSSHQGINIGRVENGQESNYGLYIEDVGNDTAESNYAILTNKGKVSFGDNLEVRKGSVTVEDGVVLKAKTGGALNGACTELGKIVFQEDNFYGCKSTGWVLLNN